MVTSKTSCDDSARWSILSRRLSTTFPSLEEMCGDWKPLYKEVKRQIFKHCQKNTCIWASDIKLSYKINKGMLYHKLTVEACRDYALIFHI